VEALAENCPQLEHLSLVGCYLLNDPCIVKLATSCPKLRCRNCLSLLFFQSLGAGIVYPSRFFKAEVPELFIPPGFSKLKIVYPS
jgi:hypothetical protein